MEKRAGRNDGVRLVDFGLMSTHRQSLAASMGSFDRACSEATREEYLRTRMLVKKELMFIALSLLSLALCHHQWLPLLQSSLQEWRPCNRVCKCGNHVMVLASVIIL